MTVSFLLQLLTVHFLADFVLQSNWMAINKSKRWDALLLHTSVYSLTFYVMALVAPLGLVWHFTLVTFVLHTATDYVTSRLTSRLWFFRRHEGAWQQDHAIDAYDHVTIVISNPWTPTVGNRHWFFVVIGLDQLIHTYSLVLAWRYLS